MDVLEKINIDPSSDDIGMYFPQSMEQKAAMLAAIVESSNDAIISKTLHGIVTSWNKAAERMYGYSAEEMIGQSITKLLPPDRQDEERQILERLKKGEVVEHFETKRVTKDNRIIDLSLTISPIKDRNGNIIGASKVARDISERKQLDRSISDREERIRVASKSAGLGIWEFSPITKRIIWSAECKTMYGVDPDFEPTSKFIEDKMHPADKDLVHQQVLIATDPDQSPDFEVTYRVFNEAAKEWRWLKVNGKTIFSEDRIAERFIGTMADITKERDAQQLIREKEEQFRMAVASTNLGTWEFFPMTGKLTWSKACKKIYDVPEDFEANFDFFSRHIHPDDASFVNAAITEAMSPSGDGNYDIRYRILRASDKQPRWIRAQGKVYLNDQRQAERFIGTVIDITEEKLTEQQLKQNVELFTTMVNRVPAMIWMSGTERHGDFFNNTWLEFTGRTLEEECNEGWLKNLHPDDVRLCTDNYQRAFRLQKGFYTEYRLRRHDGQYRWIADNSVPRNNPDGSFAGFISACMDINDQKRFREKILERELHFKTIANVSPVGLWMTDINGHNLFVNDTWIEWTGIPFERQLGVGWLDRVLEEDKETSTTRFMECLLKREKYSSVFRLRNARDEICWCLTEGSPYYDIDGEFAGYAGSVTDITQMRQLEERKDDFIRMASHELKTPITSIKGYVQLLMNIYNELGDEKIKASMPTIRSSLGVISKQVTKLTRLISELLDLSKIESGRLELHKTAFDLSALMEETVQDIRLTTSRHAILVDNDFEGAVFADKDRIAQVLSNLLTNAVKYSPDAEQVKITMRKAGKFAIIKIKDFGIGIEKKEQSKIFERFYRVEGKSELTFPGFGIGLFIASEIVQRHEGTITVFSEKGKGSEFTVTIPILTKY